MSNPRYQLSDASKAPGGASLQQAVSSKLDDLFTEFMSLYSLVRAARAQSNAQLKAGFFALAEARHAAPSAVLDSTSYSGRDMLPSWGAAVLPVDAEDARVVDGRLQIDGTLRFELQAVKIIDDDEDAEDEADFAEAAGKREEAAAMRKRGGGKAAEAKSDAAPAASASADAAPAQPTSLDLRQTPLQWFGVLPPPQLPVAADSFRAALTPLLEIASLTQRMSELQRKFAFLAHTQQASHVDPDAEQQLADILEKIKLSDAKKAAARGEDKPNEAAAASAASSHYCGVCFSSHAKEAACGSAK